jgi:hypothetical protein
MSASNLPTDTFPLSDWLAQAIEELNAETDEGKRLLLFAEVESLRRQIKERQ